MKSNYKVNDKFSPLQFNQTDFGNIYHNTPRECREPSTIEELASVFKEYNQKGVSVTIRNTGHSVNGQTLTDGVQVSVGRIKGIKFDRDKEEVVVGAGNTWDEMFKAINFSDYCPPVFPNNPGQLIKIGGTSSAGGVGLYSSKHGGFWNHISAIKVVIMSGEIIECSRTENSDFFRYSLGGFGRIGVIGEVTLKVHRSCREILGLCLTYYNKEKYYEDLYMMASDPLLDVVCGQEQVSHGWWSMAKKFKNILVAIDMNESADVEETLKLVKQKYNFDLCLPVRGDGSDKYGIDLTSAHSKMAKRGLVYFYPISRIDHSGLSHPWSDYIVGKENHQKFLNECEKLLRKYGLARYLLRESILHGLWHIDALPSYIIKNMGGDFPLSLDIKGNDFSLSASIMTAVPASKLNISLKMAKELTDLVYEMGGKRYLYGVHDLTSEQVEKHFTKSVIERWNQLKSDLDPKHLLNIGVIEHLD